HLNARGDVVGRDLDHGARLQMHTRGSSHRSFPARCSSHGRVYPVASGFSFGFEGMDASGRGNDLTSWVAAGTGGGGASTSGGSGSPAIRAVSRSLPNDSRSRRALATRSGISPWSGSTLRARPEPSPMMRRTSLSI